MARVEPRVPSSLECDWLEKKLSKVGRGRFLSARTLDQKHLRREGLLQSRNRELLMSASSGGIATPREFSRLRRLRASLAADKQVAARRRKQQRAQDPGERGSSPRTADPHSPSALTREDEQLLAEQKARDSEMEERQRAKHTADNARPDVGVGQVVRIRSNITQPAYGWGNLEGNARGTVIQVRLVSRPLEPQKKEWHYLVELLETPYHHAVRKPRFWVSQHEIEGRRTHVDAEGTAAMMAKLIPERQIDWARIDRLATPKSRAGSDDEPNAAWSGGASWSQSSGMLGYETAVMGSTLSSMATSIGDPNCFAYPFVPMTSPRSQKLAKGRRAQLERMARANTERTRPVDADVQVELQMEMPSDPAELGALQREFRTDLAAALGVDPSQVGNVEAQTERQAESQPFTHGPADGGASSSEDGAVGADTPTQSCGTRSGSRGSTPRTRPQTSYGELLYRSSQPTLTVADGVDTAESVGSGASGTWDARSPRTKKGSTSARATMAPQLARLPPFTPRMQRTCGVYGISPQYRVVRYTTGSGTVKAHHEHKPVPPMPVHDDAF